MRPDTAFLAVAVLVAFATIFLVLATWIPTLRQWSRAFIVIAIGGIAILVLAAVGPIALWLISGSRNSD